jgi:hypothetical protein
MSGRFQTNHRRPHDSAKKAECFAVAAGHQTGIFFTREEMIRCTKTFPDRLVQSFATVHDAEAFLRQQGLEPIISSNGWLSTKKAPILYQRLSSNKHCERVTPIKPSVSPATSTPEGLHSSQSLTTIHSSPEEKHETLLMPTNLSSHPNKKLKGMVEENVIEIHSDSDNDDAEHEEHVKPSLPRNDVEFDTVQQQAIDAGKNTIFEAAAVIFIPTILQSHLFVWFSL